MSRLSEAARCTPINGRHSATISQRDPAASGANTLLPSKSAQEYCAYDGYSTSPTSTDATTSPTSTEAKIRQVSSTVSSHPSIVPARAAVYASLVTSSATSSTTSLATSSTTSSATSSATSLTTSLATPGSPSVSPPPATSTIQSTPTAPSGTPSPQTPASTSEWTSAPQSQKSHSSSATRLMANKYASSLDNSSVGKPAEDNSSESKAESNPQQDRPSVDNSLPNIIPPAQQVENLAQPSGILPLTTQNNPSISSNQVPRPDVSLASDIPSPNLPTGASRASIPASLVSEAAGLKNSGTEALTSTLPTTLVTFSRSRLVSPTIQEGDRQQRPLETGLPLETAATLVLTGAPAAITAVGGEHGGSGNTEWPNIEVSHSSNDSRSHLSPGAIAGISLAAIFGLVLAVFMIWLAKRRSRKRSYPQGSPAGHDGKDPWTNRSSRASYAATDMAERQVPSGFQPAFFRGIGRAGPSHQQVLQPTTARQMPSKSYLDHEGQRGLGVDQGQINFTNPFSDRNATGLLLQPPSLPPTALLFNVPSPGRPKRDANTSANAKPGFGSPCHGRSLSAAEWTSKRASQYSASRAMPARPHSVHRESSPIVDPFSSIHNKFCPNPFDLEIESRLVQSRVPTPRMPPQLTASQAFFDTAASNSSSKYSSGVAVSDSSALGEIRPYKPVTVALEPTKQFATWDLPVLRKSSETVDLEQPGTAARQPPLMIGQAL
ncbi:hypothetical protein E4U42_003937 [Claviceps africana]|uniref:Uncharacterized protein n=1 Tax=Claviceps africana TaxID=83212 RepID=A0A8K0J8R3_9HYPO|nr:hypothetical protein E4U42_003937 [Claviceps africana]